MPGLAVKSKALLYLCKSWVEEYKCKWKLSELSFTSSICKIGIDIDRVTMTYKKNPPKKQPTQKKPQTQNTKLQ